jgi:DNA-binding MarR family transcriptional regulator
VSSGPEMRSGTERTAAVLLELLPQLMRFLHEGFRDHPLTLQQLRVLGALADSERSAGDVAAELGIRPQTLTGLLEPLYRQGLITRRRDPVAWRVVRLGLTPAGEDVHESLVVAARKRLAGLVANLRPPDQVALTRSLLALGEELRQACAQPSERGEGVAAQWRASMRGGGANKPAR